MNYLRWAVSYLSYLMGCELSKMGSGLGIAAHLATGADNLKTSFRARYLCLDTSGSRVLGGEVAQRGLFVGVTQQLPCACPSVERSGEELVLPARSVLSAGSAGAPSPRAGSCISCLGCPAQRRRQPLRRKGREQEQIQDLRWGWLVCSPTACCRVVLAKQTKQALWFSSLQKLRCWVQPQALGAASKKVAGAASSSVPPSCACPRL